MKQQKKSKRNYKIGKKIKKVKNTTSKVKQYIINSKRKKKTVSKYEEAIENAKKFSTILKAKSQKAIKRSNSVSKMDLETYYNKIMRIINLLEQIRLMLCFSNFDGCFLKLFPHLF